MNEKARARERERMREGGERERIAKCSPAPSESTPRVANEVRGFGRTPLTFSMFVSRKYFTVLV